MQPPRNAALVAVTLLVAYAIGGMSASMLLGNRFIPSYALHPALLVPVLGVPAAVIGAFVVRHFTQVGRLSSRILSLAAFLMFTGATAALLFGATRGWVAIASEVLPKQAATLELKVLAVGRSESRRSVCHQHLELQHGSSIERLCADKLPLQGQLSAGSLVRLIGVASPLGFHIRELQAPRGDA